MGSVIDTRMKNRIKFTFALFGSRFASTENAERAHKERTRQGVHRRIEKRSAQSYIRLDCRGLQNGVSESPDKARLLRPAFRAVSEGCPRSAFDELQKSGLRNISNYFCRFFSTQRVRSCYKSSIIIAGLKQLLITVSVTSLPSPPV